MDNFTALYTLYALLLVLFQCTLPLVITGFLFSSTNLCCLSFVSKMLQAKSIMPRLLRQVKHKHAGVI